MNFAHYGVGNIRLKQTEPMRTAPFSAKNHDPKRPLLERIEPFEFMGQSILAYLQLNNIYTGHVRLSQKESNLNPTPTRG